MRVPDVHYALTDDRARIAYQDVGSGTPVVIVTGPFTHLEALWAVEPIRRFYERIVANMRLLTFDHRGTGMSDGFTDPPSLEVRALDIKAVLDTAEIEQAHLMAFDFGAQVAVGFAVDHPDRVMRMVLTNARVGRSARARADELNPGAAPPPASTTREANLAKSELFGVELDENLLLLNPSATDHPDVVAGALDFDRKVGTRDVRTRQIESVYPIDITGIAGRVDTPTLVSNSSGNRFRHIGYARVLVELIPDSTLHIFESDDHMFWLSENASEVTDHYIEFLTGAPPQDPAEPRLATILFTDIVGSTERSVAAGDDEWRRALDRHDRIAAGVVTRHNGTIVKHTGDGVLAAFDLPSRAVDAAVALRSELAAAGLSIRAGLHAGEVQVRGHDIAGSAVNLAARVEQTAADGEILATATVIQLLLGSSHQFEHAVSTDLKGFEGTWELYRVKG